MPLRSLRYGIIGIVKTTGMLGLAAYLWIFVSYFRNAYRSGGWALLALSGGVLAYILQLQTAFTTLATGVTFWAVLGVSVAIMRGTRRGRAGFGARADCPDHLRLAASRGMVLCMA